MLNIIAVTKNYMRKLTITVTLYCCEMGYVTDIWCLYMWLVDMGFCRVMSELRFYIPVYETS